MRELTLGYTGFIRGETGDSQILTGRAGHAKETGLYVAVRGPVEVSPGKGFSCSCCRQVTGCRVKNRLERNKIRGRKLVNSPDGS